MSELKKEIDDAAELAVRRYFDHYLIEIFPVQIKTAIRLHDSDSGAHGGTERKFTKLVYVGIGVAVASGGVIGHMLSGIFGF